MPYQHPQPPDCLPEFECDDCGHLWTSDDCEFTYDKFDGWRATDRCSECGTVTDSYLSTSFMWTKGVAPW